jgi:hypothetical protein
MDSKNIRDMWQFRRTVVLMGVIFNLCVLVETCMCINFDVSAMVERYELNIEIAS